METASLAVQIKPHPTKTDHYEGNIDYIDFEKMTLAVFRLVNCKPGFHHAIHAAIGPVFPQENSKEKEPTDGEGE